MTYPYSRYSYADDRDKLIEALCEGKRVLHIGACDSPYTEIKLQQDLLLHRALDGVASELRGVDIDEQSIEYLRARGIDNIECVDIAEYDSSGFDIESIVFGETIEHLENPGEFLRHLKKHMSDRTELIISTPNCYSLFFQSMVLRGQENIHPDHVIGFSAALLSQLLESIGFQIRSLHFTFLPRDRENLKKKIWKVLAKMRNGWAETLVVRAVKDGESI